MCPALMASRRLTEIAEPTLIPAPVRASSTPMATAARVCSSWASVADAQLIHPLRLPHGSG